VTIRLAPPACEEDWRAARRLIEEYAASLNVDLSFQDFAHELENLPRIYAPPTGNFLLAEESGAYLGCIGLRQLSAGVGEIKRLYAVPAARGRRVGRLLVDGIIAAAARLGYHKLLLDTLSDMRAARTLYASVGFRPTQPYRFNPVEGAIFMELTF
jgi:GNAT superfamily N-acetyltransferase